MAALIIGLGSPHDRRSIALETRSGWFIENVRQDQRPPVQMAAGFRLHRESHPNIVLRSAASTYNCAGLVLASRRTAIDVGLVPRILREDGYRQIEWTQACQGDVVLYLDQRGGVSHVGVIATLPPLRPGQLRAMTILSQWGSDGEYLHALHDVPPLYGQPGEVWTDRVPGE